MTTKKSYDFLINESVNKNSSSMLAIDMIY